MFLRYLPGCITYLCLVLCAAVKTEAVCTVVSSPSLHNVNDKNEYIKRWKLYSTKSHRIDGPEPSISTMQKNNTENIYIYWILRDA